MKLKIIVLSFILASAQNVYPQFIQGTIIDKYAAEYPGWIKPPKGPVSHSYSEKICEETILYKETQKAKKEKLTVNDVNGFQVGDDSFIAVKNYSIPLDDKVHNVFARIILESLNGSLCTFKEIHTTGGMYSPSPNAPPFSPSSSKTETFYLIYRDKKFTQLTEYNFSHEMPSLVSDKPDLQRRIANKNLTFKNIDEIIAEYNSR